MDPKDVLNPTKYLAPEALRGSGGILVNNLGERFVNELDLRSVVSKAIFDNCQALEAGTDAEPKPGPAAAWVILGVEAQALFGEATLRFYKDRLGLLQDCADVDACAGAIGCTPAALRATLAEYAAAAALGVCQRTGKMVFPSALAPDDKGLLLARVTPSVHYCMGGLEISAAAEVLELVPDLVVGRRRHIRRLFAAGEVTGGVHGANRLGGNSLLECVVFGRIAGERAALVNTSSACAFVNDHEQMQAQEQPLAPKEEPAHAPWVPCALREIRNTDKIYGKRTRELRFDLHGSLQTTGLKVGQYLALRGELLPALNCCIGFLSTLDSRLTDTIIDICQATSTATRCSATFLQSRGRATKVSSASCAASTRRAGPSTSCWSAFALAACSRCAPWADSSSTSPTGQGRAPACRGAAVASAASGYSRAEPASLQ